MGKSVGLILIIKVKVPSFIGRSEEYRVVLRRRGLWNWEKNAPESWRNSFQVTCHGKCQEGEDFKKALKRELQEKMWFSKKKIIKIIKNMHKVPHQLFKKDEEEIKIFFCIVPFDWIAKSPAQDCLLPISKNEAGEIKRIEDHLVDGRIPDKDTIFPTEEIWMWRDEAAAVGWVFFLIALEKEFHKKIL